MFTTYDNVTDTKRTGAEIVAKNIKLPRVSVGNLITISNAGSYSAVISPMKFSSLVPPSELFYKLDGTIEK